MKHDPDWQAREDKASLLIGRIVRFWSRLDQWAWSTVGCFQMMVRARHSRIPRAFYPETPAEITPSWEVGDFHPPAGDESRVRFRHVRRLAGVLVKDPKVTVPLNKKLDEAMRLYDIRNDLVHADVSIQAPWEGDGITLYSQKWSERIHQERKKKKKSIGSDLSRHRDYFAKIAANWDLSCGRKSYTFGELETVADRLDHLWWELRELSERIPIKGEPIPPVETPRRR